MRLYNSKSCTPVGSGSSKRTRLTSPKAFVPTRPSGEQRTSRFKPSSFSLDFRDDGEDFPDDETSHQMNCLSPVNVSHGNLQRNCCSGLSKSFAITGRQWPSSAARKYPIRRQISWSPSKSSASLLVVQNNEMLSNAPPFMLQPQHGKHSHHGNVLSATSPNEIAKPNAELGCKLSATQSTSDESSTTWLDFSLDGSENPFNDERFAAPPLHFLPIEKAPQRRTLMMIKPTPVQRTKSSHSFFPTQHSRQAPSLVTTFDKDTTTFVATAKKFSPAAFKKPDDKKNASTPRLSPSPRDVEPMGLIDNRMKSKPRMLVDLAKYSSMLKSRVPFELVKKIMEREGVDSSIIELTTAAHNLGTL